MRLVVFGSNGQVGQALKQVCAGVDTIQYIGVNRQDCDISNEEQVKKTIAELEPDLIVNAAAYTAVDKAEEEREACFDVNENAVRHIAMHATCPVIHFSTDYVFNGQQHVPYEAEDPVAPMGVYAQSKVAGERALQEHCPRHLILRTAWVYSPYGHNFVKTMLRLMGEKERIGVVGDQIGSPTSAQDLAEAVIKIAQQVSAKEFCHFGTYHLVSEAAVSWYDFACEIRDQAGLSCQVDKITTKDYPTPAPRPAYTVLSVKKFQNRFGFGLPDWKISLSKCLRVMKNQGRNI